MFFPFFCLHFIENVLLYILGYAVSRLNLDEAADIQLLKAINLRKEFLSMSTYRGRSSRRRGKPRYDRIIGALAIFIVFIILFVSCCKSCGNDDEKSNDTSSIVPTDTNGNESGVDQVEDPSAAASENYTTETKIPDDIYKGNLVLVNNQHAYSFPTSEEDSTIVTLHDHKSDSYKVSDYETSLNTNVINSLNKLMDDFYTEKSLADIMVIGAYRTKEDQDERFNTGTSDVKGGYTDYHTGLSFDLGIFPEGENSYYYIPEGEYAWISENCAKYGFILRYPDKKQDKTGTDSKSYQFRYVGIPHAIYMSENNMCLEEYIEFIKSYTYDSDHLKIAGPDKNYEVYYVPADMSANTEVAVPKDKTYEISGNNIDGFIVTVENSLL